MTKIIFITSLIVNNAQSAASFPRGCEVTGFGYNQNYLLLNDNGNQTYFLIQNRSDTTIEMERHETTEVFMSPPLQATLAPNNWAAFASDVKNVTFKCYKRMGEETTITDCREVLEVCQYPRVRFALSNMGNYWISFNKPQNEVIKDSVDKGIYLKW